jgi:hypothetical protein
MAIPFCGRKIFANCLPPTANFFKSSTFELWQMYPFTYSPTNQPHALFAVRGLTLFQASFIRCSK